MADKKDILIIPCDAKLQKTKSAFRTCEYCDTNIAAGKGIKYEENKDEWKYYHIYCVECPVPGCNGRSSDFKNNEFVACWACMGEIDEDNDFWMCDK